MVPGGGEVALFGGDGGDAGWGYCRGGGEMAGEAWGGVLWIAAEVEGSGCGRWDGDGV